MSKVLRSTRTKRLPSTGGVSVHSISSATGPSSQQPPPEQPVVIELAEDNESDDENGKFLKSTSDQSEQKSPNEKYAQDNPPAPSKMSLFKSCFRRLYKKLGLKHIIIFLMMVIYTIFGAIIFLSLEKQTDIDRLNKIYTDYETDRQEFARNLSAAILNNRNRDYSSLELLTLIDTRLQAYDEKRGCAPTTETQWNFWHAMYFAGTIYTTIGYGDIFCRTISGRIITMIYSLIGIPLMLIVLTDLGTLLLKVMFGLTQFCDRCKAKFSPSALFGPHPPGYDQKRPSKLETIRSDLSALKEEGGTTNLEMIEKGKIEGDDQDFDEMERREEEDYEYQLMRIPVSTALFTTIGWIFICAGLFCLWEDWDYFTSVYFFFISLSTIGLGDETPARKDIMVATYLFVIIGLSLVSMTITVIQRRLEDLYLQLLQMVLNEYHRKLLAGGDQLGATVGMMQAWQKSKAARFLMPLLSKDKKRNVAKQFQDEAAAQGIVLPAVLRDLDPKTGVPAVLQVPAPAEDNAAGDNAEMREQITNAIHHAAVKARALNEPIQEDFGFQAIYSAQSEAVPQSMGKAVVLPTPVPIPIHYDADAQTDELEVEDKQEQTIATPHADAQTQSQDTSFGSNLRVDETSQTPILEYDDVSTQCKLEEPAIPTKIEGIEDETQTDPAAILIEASSQTSKTANKDKLIQTHLYDLSLAETQTDQVQTKNQRLQTPVPEILEHEAQTDPLILDPEQFQATGTLSMADRADGKKGWAKAKKNLKQVIKKAKTNMQTSGSKAKMPAGGIKTVPSVAGIEPTPAMASWNDVAGELEDIEPDDDNGAGSGDHPRRRRPIKFIGGDEMDEEEEEEEEEEDDDDDGASRRRGSKESLHWDPIDGLHAEPQKKVGDLKRMFETEPKQQPKAVGDLKKMFEPSTTNKHQGSIKKKSK